MMFGLFFALVFLSAIGCGLMAGVFFAFSTFVVAGLARLSPAAGMSAMQSINVTAVAPPFMALFFGTGVLCIVAILSLAWKWSEPGAVYILIGGALYLVGSILVTIVFNVPLNNALAALAPADPTSAQTWTDYLRDWTMWNHVRTIACAAAAAALTVALCYQARGFGAPPPV